MLENILEVETVRSSIKNVYVNMRMMLQVRFKHGGILIDNRNMSYGYYVETISNITNEAVQKFIKEQIEESRIV